MAKARVPAVRLAVVSAMATPLMACGLAGGGLDGASTCDEFMHATAQEQMDVTQALAGEYEKPDYATPLGAPAVPYFCAQNPDFTLDEFFAGAG